MNQQHFILFPWGMIARTGERARKLLEGIQACGFNASCFVPESEFPICRELGLDIYCVPGKDHCDGSMLTHERALLNPDVSEEELYRVMEEQLQNLPPDARHVYITDEPGAGLFSRLKVLVDCVREKAPWAEAYINLFPNYAVCGAPNLSQLETDTYEEYLERFVSEVTPDSVGLDNYQVIMSDDFKNPHARENYFDNLLQAIEICQKYNIPFQFIACCHQLRHWQTIPTFANLAFQAYTALAAGARTLSWFLCFGREEYLYAPIDDTTGKDVKTSTWYILKEVNRRILPLGELLFHMEYKGMYFSAPVNLLRARCTADCSCIKSFSADEECVIGHYIDESDTDVVLVVNTSLQRSTRIYIDLGNKYQYYSTESQKWDEPYLINKRGEISPLWLEPGCGIALRAQNIH